MDTKREIQEFLTSRRARITPEQAGVRTFGSGPRRVPGLRREEVASLAGVSIAYYTKLERGDASGVSDTVLEALSRALQLDDAERAHCSTSCARNNPFRERAAAAAHRRRSGPACSGFSTGSTRRRTSATAAWTSSPRTSSARRSTPRSSPTRAAPRTQPGSASSTRARPRSSSTGTKTADASVAVLRAEAGRNPHDQDLTNLIGELSTQSEDFRVRWARHDVGTHDAGVKRLHHPLVGRLELTYEG